MSEPLYPKHASAPVDALRILSVKPLPPPPLPEFKQISTFLGPNGIIYNVYKEER